VQIAVVTLEEQPPEFYCEAFTDQQGFVAASGNRLHRAAASYISLSAQELIVFSSAMIKVKKC
jgi:hypothetical protein